MIQSIEYSLVPCCNAYTKRKKVKCQTLDGRSWNRDIFGNIIVFLVLLIRISIWPDGISCSFESSTTVTVQQTR